MARWATTLPDTGLRAPFRYFMDQEIASSPDNLDEILRYYFHNPEMDGLFAAFEDLENGLFFAALSVSSGDPRVQPFLVRAAERRLALGVAAFQDLGLDLAEARERALLAYAAYAGYFQLLRTTPGAVTAVTDLSGYVRRLAEALVPAKGPRL